MVKFLDSEGYCMLSPKACDQQSCEYCDDYKAHRTCEKVNGRADKQNLIRPQ